MAESVSIRFSIQIDGEYILLPTTEMTVFAGEAARFGLIDEADPDGVPVALDAVIEAHKMLLGDAFTPETCGDYLEMQAKHWLGRALGKKAFFSGFTINGFYAYDMESGYSARGYKGLPFDKAHIVDGDMVEVFAFQDSFGMDYYTYFLQDGKRINELKAAPGEKVPLVLEGFMFGFGGPLKRSDRAEQRLLSEVSEAQLVLVDPATKELAPIEGMETDEDGAVSVGFDAPGTYYVSSVGGSCRYNSHLVLPWLTVSVA
ncbi:MAG: hypothetical protein IJ131_04640 [Eggerthellaceae bacterium]|nr:hypothetical protein [Eggerthellaceae bacterium]